jgi:hypothetical protein
MKKRKLYLLVFIILPFLITCDPGGNLFLTNGYSYDVLVYGVYEYRDEIYKKTIEMPSETGFAPAGMGHIEYNNITGICIKDTNGIVLAEYNPEYILRIRSAFKQNGNQQEFWIFTEKGLFIKTKRIEQKYKFDFEKILEYYRSDEAVKELEAALGGADRKLQ